MKTTQTNCVQNKLTDADVVLDKTNCVYSGRVNIHTGKLHFTRNSLILNNDHAQVGRKKTDSLSPFID